jgi:type I restriction enzyme R subunit/putative DNA methylase
MKNIEQQNNKNWYSRGYLPHYDNTHLVQSITFRLADTLPQNMLRKLEIQLKSIPEDKHSAT